VTKKKGQINKLITRGGFCFSSRPIEIEKFREKQIEKVMTRKNACLAFDANGKVYNWGHFPRGLGCTPQNVHIDVPKKNEVLQGHAFRDI